MKENETKTQKKEPSKGAKVFKSVINTIINILIVIVLITSLLIAVMALTSRANGISTIFGYTIQTIQSDSMKGGSPDGYPEGDFSAGDLMIAKATSGNSDAEYYLGDIVTFIDVDTDGKDMLIVHRIVDAVDTESGETVYQTQGDNRAVAEVPDQSSVENYITADRFVSVYYTKGFTGKIIKGVGSFLDYLRSQQGFFFVVLLPMIIFFMYELIRVVLNFTTYRKAKEEEDKQAAVDAAVAEALSDKSDEPSADNMTDEEREQFRQFLEFQKMQKAQQEAQTEQPAESDTEE